MRGAAGGVLLYRRHRPFAGFINTGRPTQPGHTAFLFGVEHVLASILVAFNGLPYDKFFEKINRDSITEGRSWWGYIDRRGERFNPVVDVEAEGPEN